VTPVVDELFRSPDNDDILDVVYVASDTTEEQMKGYVPSGWSTIPFEAEEERSKLKRHFGCCASKEVEPLGMKPQDRKFGIPTLILLDSSSGKIVSTGGASDVMKSPRPLDAKKIYDSWVALKTETSSTVLDSTALSTEFPSWRVLSRVEKKLVGLYFAASWCPDCTGVTPVVDEVFRSAVNDGLMDLVYVASDTTEEQMKGYVPSGWSAVPFEAEEERSKLKRHFGCCASKEVGPLGMKPEDRKFGIPTLILLDASSGKVVSTDGVNDVMKASPPDAQKIYDSWIGGAVSS